MITIKDFHTYDDAVICQKDGDMGDGLQRTSMYLIGKALLNEHDGLTAALALSQLWPRGFTRPRRDPIKWIDPNDVSRDQEDPLAIFCYLYEYDSKWKALLKDRYRRFGRYQNKDWAGPIQWATDIRMLNGWYSYPLLLVLDLAFPITAIIDVVKAWVTKGKDNSNLDVDNCITRLCFSAHVLPTFWIFIARKIYDLFPENLGGKGIISALKWKHRESAGANPAMFLLWEKVWKLSFE